MVLARHSGIAQDDEGNAQGSASIEVRQETAGAPLALLYSDRDGTVSIGNPFTADSDGSFAFHVDGGSYRITATKGAFSKTLRYLGIGTAQEYDFDDVGALVQNVDAGYALTFESETSAPPSAGAIRFNNSDLSAATEVYVSTENLGGSNIELRLLELYSASRTVKDTFSIADPASNAQASWQIDGAALVGSPGDYVTLTISNHAGATSFTDNERVNFQPNRAGADGTDGNDGADGDVVTSGAVVEGQVTEYASATGGTIRGATEEGSPTTPLLSAQLLRSEFVPIEDGQFAVYDGVSGRKIKPGESGESPSEPFGPSTDAQVRQAMAGRLIDAAKLRTANEPVALTDAATVAIDWTAGINFTLTLTTDRILGNPTNAIPGQCRTLFVISDGGPDELTFGSEYGGVPPTLDDITTTKAYWMTIYCRAAGQFLVSAIDGSPA